MVSQATLASLSIVSSQIDDLNVQLQDINDQIQDTIKDISIYSNKCQEFQDCTGCTSSSSCVWCNTGSGYCTEGQSKGPYRSRCSSYSYKTCQGQTCSDFDACSSCTSNSCIWCSLQYSCYDPADQKALNCPTKNYYNTEDSCPPETDPEGGFNYINSYVYSNPTFSVDLEEQALENHLSDLETQAGSIQEEINKLSLYQKKILNESNTLQSMQVAPIYVDSINGTADQVQQMYLNELAQAQQYEQNVTFQEENQTVSSFQDSTDTNTQVLINELNTITEDLKIRIEKNQIKVKNNKK